VDASIKYLCRERKTGDFERTFYIDMIDKKAVNVAFENGILHVVLPKQKEEDNRTVFDIE
jgi:HSP20 family protein